MTNHAPIGLIGVLTPRADASCERELSLLCPPGVAMLTAPVTGRPVAGTTHRTGYLRTMELTLDALNAAPLGVAAFAGAGVDYQVDPDEERATLARLALRHGYPVITATSALAEALATLRARRIGLLSGFDDPLHERAVAYWQRRGLEIGAVHRFGGDAPVAWPEDLARPPVQAIVIIGPAPPAQPSETGGPVPVLAAGPCLMWRAMLCLRSAAPSPGNLWPWLTGDAWPRRARTRSVRSNL